MESLFKILKPVFTNSDERGSMVQLFQENCNQANVLRCKKGALRGNHYHKLNTESFYVVEGEVEVTLKTLEQKPVVETKTFSKGDFFAIPPNINHELLFKEDTIMTAFYDKGVILPDKTTDIYIYIYI